MKRAICIHGHFYQIPRENPWLEEVEVQDSAYPYHDWNERICAECYAPNAVARIMDREGRISHIINNYARISFAFGPTLLSWLERHAAETYQAIVTADRESQTRFSGHGSAMAQTYNHMIMPLANRADRITQIVWGMYDFSHRFGRDPEGMWLPELAVDLETLDLIAEYGIRFAVLSPYQAQRVRPLDSGSWVDVLGGQIDPTMPYIQQLPSGRTIVLFFYHEALARAVVSEGLLRSGEQLAHRLLNGFREQRTGQEHQLVHIATNGEIYGHHHRYGDMALAYALHTIESSDRAALTNYGEFLDWQAPTHEVDILENTSWSCTQGIERWRSGDGSNTGQHPGWQQAWREPLRQACDWLRDTLRPQYEEQARTLFTDPWQTRNDYIALILDRSAENLSAFLARNTTRVLAYEEQIQALTLLELQRHLLLMYTSCGWFFDDISGSETVQTLLYAGRAIQLADTLFDMTTEPTFLEMLEQTRSNLPEQRNGRHVYENGCSQPKLTCCK